MPRLATWPRIDNGASLMIRTSAWGNWARAARTFSSRSSSLSCAYGVSASLTISAMSTSLRGVVRPSAAVSHRGTPASPLGSPAASLATQSAISRRERPFGRIPWDHYRCASREGQAPHCGLALIRLCAGVVPATGAGAIHRAPYGRARRRIRSVPSCASVVLLHANVPPVRAVEPPSRVGKGVWGLGQPCAQAAVRRRASVACAVHGGEPVRSAARVPPHPRPYGRLRWRIRIRAILRIRCSPTRAGPPVRAVEPPSRVGKGVWGLGQPRASVACAVHGGKPVTSAAHIRGSRDRPCGITPRAG